MKKLWIMLKTHFQEDFSWSYYLSVLAFLSVFLTLNYFFELEEMVDRSGHRVAGYFLLYGTAYYGGFLLMAYFKKQSQMLRSRNFWLMSLLGLFVLSFSAGFPYLVQLLNRLEFDPRIYGWIHSLAVNMIGLPLVCIPLLIIYLAVPISRKNSFGLNSPGFDPKPYFIILLIMLPLVVIASFTDGFLSYYPTYRQNSVAQVLDIPTWVPPALYEFFYGIDFFNVEILFRGFMVIGFTQILGKNAIIPMVTTYCFLHFGKPMGEAISSIFGGYILGVVAFYTRGVWGGVIVHMGIAWMMDLAAAIQKAVER